MMDSHPRTKYCPHCDGQIPYDAELCPLCGKKIRPKWGELTDEQIKRIRRPLTVILVVVVLIIYYFKYFK